eukprot:1190802-Prorocentrum_minimum.AAC.3
MFKPASLPLDVGETAVESVGSASQRQTVVDSEKRVTTRGTTSYGCSAADARSDQRVPHNRHEYQPRLES